MSPHGVVKRYADIFLYHCLWGGQIIGGYKLWGDTNYEGIQKFHKLIRNKSFFISVHKSVAPTRASAGIHHHIASRACHATSRTGVRRYPPSHGHPAHATPHPALASAGIRHHTGIPRMPRHIPHGRPQVSATTRASRACHIPHMPHSIPHGRPQDADLIVTGFTEAQRRCARSGTLKK